jgi:hypothetical protein
MPSRGVFANVLFAVIGLCLFAGGIWKLTSGFHDITQAWASSQWPYVEGKITEARVIIGHSSGGPHGGGGPTYEPHVTYAYIVDGKTFTGSSIGPGRLWSSRSAYAVVGSFPSGSNARIYYAPAEIPKSTLITGLHFFNFGNIALGMAALTMGSLFVLVGTRAKYVSATSNRLEVSRIPGGLRAGLLILFFASVVTIILLSRA